MWHMITYVDCADERHVCVHTKYKLQLDDFYTMTCTSTCNVRTQQERPV